MTTHAMLTAEPTRSFPVDDAVTRRLLDLAVGPDAADVVICPPGGRAPWRGHRTVAVELDRDCLGVVTGETAGNEGSTAVGFARFRNGDDAPSSLVELVVQPATDPAALAAVREVFARVGLTTVVCSDQAGRILDRLVVPKYNAALRLLDEGLATASDMDLTCRLGLGYPDGPIERVERGGLANHYETCKALFEVYGTPGYAPARRAVVAAARRGR